MKYITGQLALNLPCKLKTSGDWHFSSIDWSIIEDKLVESDESFFKDYGIEKNRKLFKESDKLYNVANTIRACLDLMCNKQFSIIQGMNEDFICNEKYDKEIFKKVYEMKDLSYFHEIHEFMIHEYRQKWLNFKQQTDFVQQLDCLSKKKFKTLSR